MLLVKEFLKTHSFKELEDIHGVEVSFSLDGSLFSLNYSQINSKDSNVLAQQCRGLILSFSDYNKIPQRIGTVGRKFDYYDIIPGDTFIVAWPMNRFFNAGQEAAATINWNDDKLQVLNKLDGTLCICYFNSIKNVWSVATRSTPEADIPLEFDKFTFRKLFEKAINDQFNLSFDEFCKFLDINNTYCFELTSPYNTIVCRYADCKITLLAIRNIVTGNEICPVSNKEQIAFVPVPELYDLKQLDDIFKYVDQINPIENEGVVIRDSNFNRLKVKSPSYVAFNRAAFDIKGSKRACLEIVLSEKVDDIYPFMPEEIANSLLNMKEKVHSFIKDFIINYDKLVKQTEALMLAFKELDGKKQKTFAILVNNSNIWKDPVFSIYSGKIKDIHEYIKNQNKNGFNNSFLDSILKQIGEK